MSVRLDEIVYRSYIVKYIVRLLEYIMAVGKKIGMEEALKTYASTEWRRGRTWVKENLSKLDIRGEDAKAAWALVKHSLRMFDPRPINPSENKIVEDRPEKVVVHRTAWCPILEACKVLNLPPHEIYPHFIIQNADALIKTLNPKLSIRMGKLKPEKNFVEYIIELEK
ncbi:MAG: hypothetical protein GTN80_05020 [Nitrososphaeria archaeon]|nr:hypothetical protein [Nitrososphaeria archaeon]NIQ32988.1 hypothetical protein [Nitrososphaeria archaeon]